MKVKSSIEAPLRDIDPIILSFSNLTLSFSFKASSLDIWTKVSFWSKLGVSVFCSIFFSSIFWDFFGCYGIKNNEYKTITAEDKAIAAMTFFESIIF